MNKLLKTAITLTAIGVAVKVVRKNKKQVDSIKVVDSLSPSGYKLAQ